jgi:hypothetical protein
MEALRTNLERLVVQSVIGEVASPLYGFVAFRVGADGTPRALPSTGGIVYNFRIGDSATQLAGDHVEPGVSIRNFEGDRSATSPTEASDCWATRASAPGVLTLPGLSEVFRFTQP